MWETFKKIVNSFTRSDSEWKKEFNYVEQPKDVDVVWRSIYTTGHIEVPIKMLYARINTPKGLVVKPIEQTPHYSWIKDILYKQDDSDSRTKYYDYIKTYYPKENTNSELSRIEEMALFLKNNKDTWGKYDSSIVVFPPVKKRGGYCVILYDGVHRSSTALALGKESVRCRVVKEKIRI